MGFRFVFGWSLVLCGCASGTEMGREAGTADVAATATSGGEVTEEMTSGGQPESTTGPGASGTPTTSSDETTGAATTALPTTGSSTTGEEPGSSGSTGEMVGSPGCALATPPNDGLHTFTLDGYERQYTLRLPANYTNDRAWPLIFALHGNGGNTSYWDQIGGDRDVRTTFADEAILIIPEAINNAWRDYNEPAETWPMFMDLELNFFDTVYQQAQEEMCIDTQNVFSMGFSGGGSFSGVLGCRRDYIRAIAVGGSVIYFDEQDCTEQPAAWITIGEQEYNGGREDFLFFFRDHSGCEETSANGSPAGCVDYDGCGGGSPVTYCTHPGGHTWPSLGLDATKRFFQSFYAP